MSNMEKNAETCNLSALENDISQAKKDLMLRFVKDQEALQTSQVDLKTVDDETLDLMDNICVSTISMPDPSRVSSAKRDNQTKRISRRSAKHRSNVHCDIIPKGDGLSRAENDLERPRDCTQRGVKAALIRHPRSPSATSTPPSSRKIHKLSSSPLDGEERNDIVPSGARVLSGKKSLQTHLFTGNLVSNTKVNQCKPSGSGTASYIKVQNQGAKSPVKALYRPKSSYMLRHMQSPSPENLQNGAKRINSAGNQAKTDEFSSVVQMTRNATRNKYGLARPPSRGRNVKVGSFEQALTLDRQVEIESLHTKDVRVLNCATSVDNNVGTYKLCQRHQLPPITHEASPAPTPPV